MHVEPIYKEQQLTGYLRFDYHRSLVDAKGLLLRTQLSLAALFAVQMCRRDRVYQMLAWMTEGYMHDKLSYQEALNLKDIMRDFEEWKIMFKKISYKKEYHEKKLRQHL